MIYGWSSCNIRWNCELLLGLLVVLVVVVFCSFLVLRVLTEQQTSRQPLAQCHQLSTEDSSFLGPISDSLLFCTLRGLVDWGGDEQGRRLKEQECRKCSLVGAFGSEFLVTGVCARARTNTLRCTEGKDETEICSHPQILQSCCLLLWNSKHFRSDKGG